MAVHNRILWPGSVLTVRETRQVTGLYSNRPGNALCTSRLNVSESDHRHVGDG